MRPENSSVRVYWNSEQCRPTRKGISAVVAISTKLKRWLQPGEDWKYIKSEQFVLFAEDKN